MNTHGRRVEDALQSCRRARRALELAIAETADDVARLALGQGALRLQDAIHYIERARLCKAEVDSAHFGDGLPAAPALEPRPAAPALELERTAESEVGR